MNFPHIFFGADYNPDQWPQETWQEDARLMREAGVNLVSLGIFSWAKLEPHPGSFEFAWLDQVMDLLHENEVSVNLATPTASPPAWMVQLHPEMLPVTADGVILWNGSRRHYCSHNPDYHRYATRIAKTLAEHYKTHPALAMWHVDNEYSCHVGECYCQNSAVAFREWLKKRYGSLEELNSAWGTAFWSQIYGNWEEIQPPRRTPSFKNPSQQLDWARFSSDSWLACFEEQRSILKEVTPNIPVTTNFMSFHKELDYFKFASKEDVVSNDSYPDTSQSDWMVEAAMACDLIRSLGNGNPWILMEQAPSQVNWRQRNAVKRPGIMRMGSMQAIARGANGVMFFQWRQSKFGAEKHHSGMLPHSGTDSRTWREIKHLGNELPKLNELLSSKLEAEVAILMDWNNWWALESDSKPSNDLKLIPNVLSFYKLLFERNIPVDIVHPDGDLKQYKLVIVPNLYLVGDNTINNLNAYVRNGGRLLMSFFSGIVDENEHIHLGGYPAPFREMLGLLIEEYVPYQTGDSNSISTLDGGSFKNTFWADVIHLIGADSLATYKDDFYAGLPAVTKHAYGKGIAYYLGTQLEPAGLAWLLEKALAEANIHPSLPDIPPGVEVTKRIGSNKEWLFILNQAGTPITVPLDRIGTDILSGFTVADKIVLPENEVAIIERNLR